MALDRHMDGGKTAASQMLCGRIAAALDGIPHDVLVAATQELGRRGTSAERGNVWVALALRTLVLSRAADAKPPVNAAAPKVPVPEVVPIVPLAEIIVPPPPPRKRATPLFSNMALDQAALLLAEMNDEPQPAPAANPALLDMALPAHQATEEPIDVVETSGSKSNAAKAGGRHTKTRAVVDAAAITASFDALFDTDDSDDQSPKSGTEVTANENGDD